MAAAAAAVVVIVLVSPHVCARFDPLALLLVLILLLILLLLLLLRVHPGEVALLADHLRVALTNLRHLRLVIF